MALDPSILREYAFTGNSQALSAYGREVLQTQPERAYVHDSLEIVAALVDNQYTVAAALIEAVRYKYQHTELKEFFDQITGLYEVFIDFSCGRFEGVRKKSTNILVLEPAKPGFQAIDRLALLKILADSAFLVDDTKEVSRLSAEAEGYALSGDGSQGLYFTNSIRVLELFNQGDFRETMLLADKTIAIARKFGYQGIAHDLTVQNVKMRCLVAMAKQDQAHQLAQEILGTARTLNMWPWYFVTNGFLIKSLAQRNKMKEALEMVRDERELIASFTFKNQLDLFADASELYVRYLLGDRERMELLMERLPNLLLVRQIKVESETSKAERGLHVIEKLPETNSRERLYKCVAFCEYYKEKESVALGYARQALELTEQTGYMQLLLLQNEIYPILLKACSIKPTSFTEELARRLTDQMKVYEAQKKGALAEPLTMREREVVQHLATGKPITQIAATLHVSMNTMKTHLRNAYRKLDVDGRQSAVVKARELFLI